MTPRERSLPPSLMMGIWSTEQTNNGGRRKNSSQKLAPTLTLWDAIQQVTERFLQTLRELCTEASMWLRSLTPQVPGVMCPDKLLSPCSHKCPPGQPLTFIIC